MNIASSSGCGAGGRISLDIEQPSPRPPHRLTAAPLHASSPAGDGVTAIQRNTAECRLGSGGQLINPINVENYRPSTQMRLRRAKLYLLIFFSARPPTQTGKYALGYSAERIFMWRYFFQPAAPHLLNKFLPVGARSSELRRFIRTGGAEGGAQEMNGNLVLFCCGMDISSV